MKCGAADASVSVKTKTSYVCACVSFIHGFGREVLTEVSHDVEGINRGSSENTSSCLETQICDGQKTLVRDDWTKAER